MKFNLSLKNLEKPEVTKNVWPHTERSLKMLSDFKPVSDLETIGDNYAAGLDILYVQRWYATFVSLFVLL